MIQMIQGNAIMLKDNTDKDRNPTHTVEHLDLKYVTLKSKDVNGDGLFIPPSTGTVYVKYVDSE